MPFSSDPTGSPPQPIAASDFAAARVEIDGLTEAQRRFNVELGASGQIGTQFGRALTTAFVGVALQGKGLGEVFRSLALSLSRMALTAAFKPLQSAFGNALQSFLSAPSLFSSAGGISAPASFPISASSALPSFGASAGGGAAGIGADWRGGASAVRSGPSIVLNVTTPDAESFRRSETQIAALLARTVGQGQRNL